MNVLICPDKFKGSLTAPQVCHAIRAGVLRQSPSANVVCHPLSDGGDGMLDILSENIAITRISLRINDPLFQPITAEYGISARGDTAYIEMSQASGLALLKAGELNVLEASTFGTGELVRDALRRGARRVVLGLGGSATNDAGMGVAAALGCRFLDPEGKELRPIGKNLGRVAEIDDRMLLPELAQSRIEIASDVQNPFYGTNGAAHVFARQKGADDKTVELLDQGLKSFADIVREKTGIDLQQVAGAGAAGGLGGGAVSLLNAKLSSGIDMIIDVTGLATKVADADLVITGEGRLDEQTLSGKVIDGVVRLARKFNKPVAVLCGSSAIAPARLKEIGISWCTSILTGDRSLQDAMLNGRQYLEESAYALLSAVEDGKRQ